MKKVEPTLPGIDLNNDGLAHEKRERVMSADALWKKLEREVHFHPTTKVATFERKQFDELAELIFSTAHRIGVEEGKKWTEWQRRMS